MARIIQFVPKQVIEQRKLEAARKEATRKVQEQAQPIRRAA